MARGVMDLLEEINAQGTTIIMVTHDPELARARSATCTSSTARSPTSTKSRSCAAARTRRRAPAGRRRETPCSRYYSTRPAQPAAQPGLTALMVLGIALGIAASMTTLTVLHVMCSDPIPWKSDQLHYVQLDNWERGTSPTPSDGRRPTR